MGLLVLGFAVQPAAAWTLQNGDGSAAACWIESAVQEFDTGYNRAKVRILVESSRVVIASDTKLDSAFGDLGVSIDKKAFVGIDRVENETAAVLVSDYDALIRQFKAGVRAAVQLRFWPTWPTTGTHSADFSLIGFSKAFKAIAEC